VDSGSKWVSLKHDIPSGIVVFLVALPLCLGIALASDAPLFAGILTGVIGGLVVSLISGSPLSVSGPAAGLTVIVATAIQRLGGYEIFLAAVVLAGVFQILLGLMRAGSLAGFFPNAVIEGMLAAIGITIVLKQIPHALGADPHFESELMFWHFVPQDNTFGQILKAFLSMSPSAIGIAGVSLALLKAWDSKAFKSSPLLSLFPGPLVVVIVGIFLNGIFHAGFPGLALHAADGHLVQLPNIQSFSSLVGELRFPNFAAFGSQAVWIVAITIALVASVETLLYVESIDKMDPLKRVSNSNRELFAQGIGNVLCGLIGGLPMTAAIVRSSANIYAGARSQWSSFVHGAVLLLTATVVPGLLNLIPLASLAAVLIHIGLKLASPRLVKKVYAQGLVQFLPFSITIVAILFTNLLTGVALGLVIGFLIVIKASYYSAITVVNQGNDYLIRFSKDVTFVHKLKLKKELQLLPHRSTVVIDGTHAMFVDNDILEMIDDFVHSAPRRGIQVQLRNLEHKRFDFLNRSMRKASTNGIVSPPITGKPGVG
jgi:MFS superfamily sulfate permease-like transporter